MEIWENGLFTGTGAVVGQPPPGTPAAPAGTSPLWLRAKRAIMVLEHIATPEARELLKTLADGEADALPTKEAKAALERLANPSAAKADAEPEAVPADPKAALTATSPDGTLKAGPGKDGIR